MRQRIDDRLELDGEPQGRDYGKRRDGEACVAGNSLDAHGRSPYQVMHLLHAHHPARVEN
jgi:hypothetical protein